MDEPKPDAAREVRQTLFPLRIVAFALATGLSGFTAYTLTVEPGNAKQQPRLWVMAS